MQQRRPPMSLSPGQSNLTSQRRLASPLWKSESTCCIRAQDEHGVGGKRAVELVAPRIVARARTSVVFCAEEGQESGAPLLIPARVNASYLTENVVETMPILLHAYAGARKC